MDLHLPPPWFIIAPGPALAPLWAGAWSMCLLWSQPRLVAAVAAAQTGPWTQSSHIAVTTAKPEQTWAVYQRLEWGQSASAKGSNRGEKRGQRLLWGVKGKGGLRLWEEGQAQGGQAWGEQVVGEDRWQGVWRQGVGVAPHYLLPHYPPQLPPLHPQPLYYHLPSRLPAFPSASPSTFSPTIFPMTYFPDFLLPQLTPPPPFHLLYGLPPLPPLPPAPTSPTTTYSSTFPYCLLSSLHSPSNLCEIFSIFHQ